MVPPQNHFFHARYFPLFWIFILLPQSLWANSTSGIFFSEYIEGSSNNKALEIYNATQTAIDLSSQNYMIRVSFNGASHTRDISLNGKIEQGGVFVIVDDDADLKILEKADQLVTGSLFNGNDAIILFQGGITGQIMDVIGQVGIDPGREWGSGNQSTKDNTLRRKANICHGTPIVNAPFDPSQQWNGFSLDQFDDLGSHASQCMPLASEEISPQSSSFEERSMKPECEGQPATIYVSSQGTIVGGDFHGEPYEMSLEGTNAKDVIVGTAQNDYIFARQGNDVVCGGAGNDLIFGQTGNDLLRGDQGKDLMFGGEGIDHCLSQSTDDFVLCETNIPDLE